MEPTASFSSVSAQKFSRYKSVRNAPSATNILRGGPVPEKANAPSKPSLSRYKSARVASASKDQGNDPQAQAGVPPVALPAVLASTRAGREELSGAKAGLVPQSSIEKARDEAYRKLTGETNPPAIQNRPVEAPRRPPGIPLAKVPTTSHQRQPSEVKTVESRRSGQIRITPVRTQTTPFLLDVPLSAINAGDRTVIVQVGTTRYDVHVSVASTCQSMLERVAEMCPELGDIQHAMLIECFTSLGLERPLRRYEKIRHVMSSWGKAYHFRVDQGMASEELAELEIPRALKQPGSISAFLSCSRQPGVWKKLWVTLEPGGLLYHSKRKDRTGNPLCYMADYDIFTPTKKQLSRFDPGKRFCYAIKSTEMRGMFVLAEDFVHFYASNEPDIIMPWYRAVHRWHSWYLVHVLGRGRDAEQEQTSNGQTKTTSTALPSSMPIAQPPENASPLRSVTHGTPSQPSALISKIPSADDAAFTGGLLALRLNSLGSTTESPSNLHRSATQRAHATSGPLIDAIPSRDEDAFTGGLLSRLPANQGVRNGGRGVRRPSRGAEPLVDLQVVGEYVPGSLLAGVESAEGGSHAFGLAIDRQKRTEGVVRTGEGL